MTIHEQKLVLKKKRSRNRKNKWLEEQNKIYTLNKAVM